MNVNSKHIQLSAVAITISVLISACGGGGGTADISSTTVTTTTTTTIVSSPIVTSGVTAPTYGAGTTKESAVLYLSAQRSACGFGLLQQDNRIDIAAQGHADYLVTNNLTGHFENQQTYPAGFIGAAPTDRFAYAGYPYSNALGLGSNENIGDLGASFGTNLGTANVMALFSVPYHGMTLLGGYRDVGIGINTPAGRNVFVMDLGSTAARPGQLLAISTVATYPCQGLTGVLSKTYADENPAPIAGRNLQTNPIGHPIYIKVRDGQTLVMTAADLRVDGSATAITLRKLDKAADTNGRIVDNSIVMYLPDTPLNTNTTYRFTGTGTNNGQPVSINFTFSTGAF